MQATASKDEVERFRLRRGDVIITKDSEAWDDIGVPSLVDYTAPDLVCGYHLAILRPREAVLDGRYLLRALQSKAVSVQFHVSANGVTRYGLSHDAIKSIALPIPPLEEQVAIARFLDHFDHRVRRYISAKRRLIALLSEQKVATINQAVTQGLDAGMRMKPSGVGWLGDVPEHWEVRRLRNVGEAIIGLTYDPKEITDSKDGILVLRASNVAGGRLVYGDNVYVKTNVPNRLITRAGDILLCARSGSRALIGKNALLDGDAVGVTFGAFMLVFRSAYNDFLSYAFNSRLFEHQSGTFLTSTINQLTKGDFYDFALPLPPAAEQVAIVEHLHNACRIIERAIDTAHIQISQVREYYTRLSSDVVTGSLEAQEAARQLPDEQPEAEPFSDIEVQSEAEGETELESAYSAEADEQP